MRLTHNEFRAMVKLRGFEVDDITDKYIYIGYDDKLFKPAKASTKLLPNIFNNIILREDLSDVWDDKVILLKDLVVENIKIKVIKFMRSKFNLSLYDAKNLVCDNWESWRRIYGAIK